MANKKDSALRTAFPKYKPDGSFETSKLKELTGVMSREIVKKKKHQEKGCKRRCQVKSA